MKATGRISPLQLAIFLHPFVMATSALSIPAITMGTAGRDMWMAPILASVVGALTVWICFRLHHRYPGQTFIEYTESILGRYAGRFVICLYLISFMYWDGIISREYGEFIVSTFLLNTPMIFIIVCLLAVCAYAVHQGLEVWARAAQLLIPMAVALIFMMTVIMAPEMHVKSMLPVLEYGPLPALRGSILPASWFSQLFIVSLFLPYVKGKGGTIMKWLLISIAFIMLTMLSINLSVLFLFGELSEGFNYAFLTAVRYISLSDFIEHLESLLMAIWLIAIFLKVTIFYHATVLGAAQLLKLADYRVLIGPVGLLIGLFSIWSASDYVMLRHLLETSLPLMGLVVQVAFPLLLLCISVLKGGKPS